MSKYISPGDADVPMILQQELQKEQQTLNQLRSQLSSGSYAANDGLAVQQQIMRKEADVASLTRELSIALRRAPSAGNSAPMAASPVAPRVVSETTKTTTRTPAVAAGGIGEYLAGMLRPQMDVQQRAIESQQAATTAAGNAEAAVTMSQADRNKQILDERLRVQGQFNLGPTAPEDLVAKTTQQLVENDARYLQERKAYDEMASTSFFDDPIGWIGAQMNRGSQAAKVNALADNEDFLTGVLRRNMSLSEDIERTVQINTNEIDRRTAEFQATQQLQSAAAKVAQLQAEGARANMSATALLGSEMRKDEKTVRQQAEDTIAEEQRRLVLEQAQARQRNDENINAVTGATTGAQALNRYSPEVKNALQAFADGGTATPGVIVQYGNGIRATNPALYNTASKLSAAVSEQVAKIRADRENPRTSAAVTWKAADDEMQAWIKIRDTIAASNSPGRPVGFGLTGKNQDTQYNPLRADVVSFAEAIQKAAATPGAPTPLPPSNLLVQMYQRLRSTVPVGELLNPINGQLQTAHERAILEAMKNMAADGTYKLADGTTAPPEFYAQQISEFYKAASSWTSNLNQATRMGLPRPDRYQAEVMQMNVRGEKSPVGVDAMNAAALANWMKQEIKARAGFKAWKELPAAYSTSGRLVP